VQPIVGGYRLRVSKDGKNADAPVNPRQNDAANPAAVFDVAAALIGNPIHIPLKEYANNTERAVAATEAARASLENSFTEFRTGASSYRDAVVTFANGVFTLTISKVGAPDRVITPILVEYDPNYIMVDAVLAAIGTTITIPFTNYVDNHDRAAAATAVARDIARGISGFLDAPNAGRAIVSWIVAANEYRLTVSKGDATPDFVVVTLRMAGAPEPPPPPPDQWLPPSATNPFLDVPNEPDWRNAGVSWATLNGITVVPAGSNFRPGDNVTRAEFVTFLHRVFRSPSAPLAPFTDMPADTTFRAAISWAYSLGITTGAPAGSSTFRPNAPITREEIAVMLHRAMGGSAPSSLGGYTDANAISSWARPAVNWAVFNEILGQGVTTLRPGANASRAEAVTMLYRLSTR